MMGFYATYILPKAIDRTCRLKPNMKQREKIIHLAEGNVLEIGIGSGLNIPYYRKDRIKSLIGIDPSAEVWKENTVDISTLPYPFEFIEAYAEDIPLENRQFDTIVITYSMCSIPGIESAFEQFRRVIKPGGKLVFCEHGKAPDKAIARWQNLLNPLWKIFSGGCQLNKDIPGIINGNGFSIDQMESMYIPGWKPASFNYWGTASPR